MNAPAEPTPGGWRELRDLLVEFWREMRSPPQPLPVLYLRCDGCEQVTPHTSVQKAFSLTERGIAGGTPEPVCDGCRHPQPVAPRRRVRAFRNDRHPLRRICPGAPATRSVH